MVSWGVESRTHCGESQILLAKSQPSLGVVVEAMSTLKGMISTKQTIQKLMPYSN